MSRITIILCKNYFPSGLPVKLLPQARGKVMKLLDMKGYDHTLIEDPASWSINGL